MCKFYDLKVSPNPYYFDPKSMLDQNERIVKELSIVFALGQDNFGFGTGCLDEDFSNYGEWADEIHSAIQNGFTKKYESEGDSNGLDLRGFGKSCPFRNFMF